jgi:glycerate kinase
VARAARKLKIPVLAITGGLGEGWESVLQHGIDGITPIIDQPMTISLFPIIFNHVSFRKRIPKNKN